MNKLAIINEETGRYSVEGDMIFSTMDKKTLNSFVFLTTGKQITLDFGKVSNADSAGLALMLEWIKQARTKRVQLRFINIPEKILNLAKLSNLDLAECFSAS